MRYKLAEHINKDSRVTLKTTSERIQADIAEKMQELVRLNNAILEKLGGSLKKEKKKGDDVVELVEEKERTKTSPIPTNKQEKKKWQRKRK
jgi:hypothetical protein